MEYPNWFVREEQISLHHQDSVDLIYVTITKHLIKIHPYFYLSLFS